MALDSLKAAVSAVITANGNEEITGQILQDLFNNNIIPQLGKDRFIGEALPSTVPIASPESEQYYFATKNGIYANFGGLEISAGGFNIIIYKNNAWELHEFGKNYVDVNSGFDIVGYINKGNGVLTDATSSAYRSTPYILYKGGNIEVSGFSGNTNAAGLFIMYDKNLNYLGYINQTNGGGGNINTSNFVISENDINSETHFIRCSARDYQTYRKVYGNITIADNVFLDNIEKLKNLEAITSDTQKIDLSNGFSKNGFVNKITGIDTDTNSDYYINTGFLRYKGGDLIVTGYSGNVNLVALIALYDENFNYLGYINQPSSVNLNTTNYTIAESLINSNTYYVKATARLNQPARSVTGKISPLEDVAVFTNTQNIKKTENKINGVSQKIDQTDYFNVVGYVSKFTGVLTDATSSAYRSTPFLRYNGGDLTITGYSGNTNAAGLVLLFDAEFNYLGYLNEPGASNINTTNYTIVESLINSDTVYFRCNAGPSQSTRLVSGNFSIPDIQTLQSFKNSIDDINSTIDDINSTIEDVSPSTIFGLLNMRKKLTFNNYLGNDQNIHPKVIYKKDGIFGYPFWMAYTPYPNGVTTHENPSIAVSNDGINWITPTGLTNPVTPVEPNGYNSDTHILYREDTAELEMWYRPVEVVNGSPVDRIVRKRSTDGITWGNEEVAVPARAGILSPAVIFENNLYTMWGCSFLPQGLKATRQVSTDQTATAWGAVEILNINFGTLTPWHIDVEQTDLGYEYVIQCYEPGQGNNRSELYYVLEDLQGNFTDPKKIISINPFDSWDNQGIYRSCIIKLFGGYFVYFSAIRTNGQRSMGLMSGKDILNLK